MAAALTLYRTTIGKKAVMAITGFIGYGFVILHMIGNLKIFEGAEGFNEYAHFLRTVGYPLVPERGLLWVLRIILLASVILHITAAIQLTRIDWASRPKGYRETRRKQATFASMTLRWGGLAIFLFIVYHLAHFTFGLGIPNFGGHETAYQNVVAGFSNPINVIIYIAAVGALGLHLYHGVWSMFQTLGLNGPRTDGLWRGLATLSGILLFLGFSTVPIAVITGLVR
ncbi:MAG: succinate dehydrogenase cytochrome b subunit [Roseiflexaceae bacterium]|nr:succinate dehydrogenase cytochrome b subunit [Roseiflexaceae bacterium]